MEGLWFSDLLRLSITYSIKLAGVKLASIHVIWMWAASSTSLLNFCKHFVNYDPRSPDDMSVRRSTVQLSRFNSGESPSQVNTSRRFRGPRQKALGPSLCTGEVWELPSCDCLAIASCRVRNDCTSYCTNYHAHRPCLFPHVLYSRLQVDALQFSLFPPQQKNKRHGRGGLRGDCAMVVASPSQPRGGWGRGEG